MGLFGFSSFGDMFDGGGKGGSGSESSFKDHDDYLTDFEQRHGFQDAEAVAFSGEGDFSLSAPIQVPLPPDVSVGLKFPISEIGDIDLPGGTKLSGRLQYNLKPNEIELTGTFTDPLFGTVEIVGFGGSIDLATGEVNPNGKAFHIKTDYFPSKSGIGFGGSLNPFNGDASARLSFGTSKANVYVEANIGDVGRFALEGEIAKAQYKAAAVNDALSGLEDFFFPDQKNTDQRTAKPIVLDLDGSGFDLDIRQYVNFDMDGDGNKERTSWISGNDGFLVVDLNEDGTRGSGDGKIELQDELVLSEWGNVGDTDLQAMKHAFDDNNDNVLSASDSIWAELKVWVDADKDGETDSGELKSLASLGISQISLEYDDGSGYGDSSDELDVFGNSLLGAASFTRYGEVVAGVVGDMSIAFDGDGFRQVDVSNGFDILYEDGTIYKYLELSKSSSANVTVSSDSYNGVYGDGRVNTINASGATQSILLDGGAANDTLWGGSGDDTLIVGEGVSGGWQYADGNGGDDTYVYSRSTNNLTITGENANQGNDTLLFNDLEMSDLNFRQLDIGTLEIYWQIEGDDGRVRITHYGDHIENIATADGSVVSDIRFHGPDHVSDGYVSFDGSDGNDTIYSPDGMPYYLKGGAGDDVLVANTESTEVAFLSGGAGNDTYVYHSDAGDAWVTAWGEAPGQGHDTFQFQDLSMSDVTFRLDQNYDSNQGDVLRVIFEDDAGMTHLVSFANKGEQINSFVFTDGSNIERIVVDGWSDGRDVYSGGDGNDTIIGSSETNVIYGHGGNDTLDAGGFNGSYQHLKGGEGDDTYLYHKSNGRVFVGGEDDTSGNDTIVFTDLNLDDLSFEVVGDDEALLLRWSDSGASGFIRIENQGNYIEKFQFADGTTLSKIDVDAWSQGRDVFLGTQGDDLIVGSAQTEVIYGLSGDDTLDSGASSGSYQHLRGGWGDDTYLYGKISEKVFISRTGEDENTGTDTLVFKDLNFDELTVSIRENAGSDYGDSLHLQWSENGDSGFVDIADSGMHIEQYVFADGTTMTYDEFIF